MQNAIRGPWSARVLVPLIRLVTILIITGRLVVELYYKVGPTDNEKELSFLR
ncbi:hypothetical protein [Agarilytica rhodophyticola]|uniref:hypothetical protein n=1 Tax=Agarilytica rhodophyticola TaxID=1737490 RepID=UPI00131A40AE|nr:hypothetical protein [Agarilytica rhodophyticola]